jgi:ATP-dependent Clp protease ATP-binding subunit ClpA
MLRPITIPDTTTADHVETPDDALLMLESMVGLVPVKEELRSLMARAKVDALRRAQGAQVASVSQHMVFTGPPGVGKTEVARILGAVFHQTKMLRKGHLVETDRAGLVASYVGQTAARTLDKCREALDGILFIDEAYTLVGGGYAQDFGAEAVDTLLKFMEDNRDRIVVIVAGYPDQMKGFINMNPGLAGRFTRYIDFPAYAANDLLEILNRMAKSQGFTLPEDTAELAQSWLAERMTAKDWSNAREMRSLLERMREAQAVRIAAHTNPDLNRLTSEDLRHALRPRR